MVHKGQLDASLLFRFLERLDRSGNGRKVYRNLDYLRVHHSKPVKTCLEERRGLIVVQQLPS